MSKREESFQIPDTLNLFLSLVSVLGSVALLWLASRTSGFFLAAVGLVFSLVANTVFALMHESVHRIYHSNAVVNEWMGRLSAILFPTSFTFQRAMHLGHHKRNRTDVEMFDMYYPDDNKFLKYVQWYGLLTGFYWALVPTACLLYLACPWLLNSSLFRNKKSAAVMRTGADAMLSGLEGVSSKTIRLEILGAVAFHLLLILSGLVTWEGWILCYWIFGLHWGALQYADHAWSPRDIRNGAWNLRVNPIIKAFFLNYHDHKAHHQNPHVSWIHLPKFVTEPLSDRPSFLKIYLKMWLGPTPATQLAPVPIDPDFDKLISGVDLSNSAKYPKSL